MAWRGVVALALTIPVRAVRRTSLLPGMILHECKVPLLGPGMIINSMRSGEVAHK
jgi:hypothetical protein